MKETEAANESRLMRSNYLGIFIVLACIIDGINTVVLVGGSNSDIEENPLMAWLLAESPMLFLAVKIGSTALFVWILVRMNRKAIAYYGLHFLAIVYAALMAWQAFLWHSVF
jgi:hypothetical protein